MEFYVHHNTVIWTILLQIPSVLELIERKILWNFLNFEKRSFKPIFQIWFEWTKRSWDQKNEGDDGNILHSIHIQLKISSITIWRIACDWIRWNPRDWTISISEPRINIKGSKIVSSNLTPLPIVSIYFLRKVSCDIFYWIPII